jgi:hypothetical protein
MKVRYNPVVGVLLLVLGGVCLFLGLWLLALGEFNMSVLAGALVTLLGILHLVRPYFWVTASAVEVTAAIGPARRTFPFRTKKLPVTRWMAHSGDWTAAVERATRP